MVSILLSSGQHRAMQQLELGAGSPPEKEGGQDMTRAMLLALVSAISVWAFTGCETMEGAGRDIESAGEEIEDAAD